MPRGADEDGADVDDANIKIYMRVRPTKKPSGYFELNESNGRVSFEVPKEMVNNMVNNSRTNWDFRYDGIIGMDSTQEEVFEKVAAPVNESALAGFNATIFAYGQTGSGKTFTITGGVERYVDRGIIPRTLSWFFNKFQENSDTSYQMRISYLEIYNESGYDLLIDDDARRANDQLPKVTMMEDEDGNCHLKNLSQHIAASEEEALNLLFLGDTNRAISETSMNAASSRSHCMFTLYITARKAGSDVIRRSKLHLVDLAGSERVHKTNAKGQILNEAKFINTSLHFLEMVIVALHERSTKGRGHIPYRNSMMTSVLRDSLGGNCKTTMVATVSAEEAQTEESISTSRFAQRVALIKNNAAVNEELDPALVIKRLKGEIVELNQEIKMLKGEVGQGVELTDEDRDELRSACLAYTNDRNPLATLQIGGLTYAKITDCFAILKQMVVEERENAAGSSHSGSGGSSGAAPSDESLMGQLAQRDEEIAVLVKMVREGRTGTHANVDLDRFGSGGKYAEHTPPGQGNRGRGGAQGGGRGGGREDNLERLAGPSIPTPQVEVLQDPARAFEHFKGHYPKISAMAENKRVLKEKYMTAKAVGVKVNSARTEINRLKKGIEKIRKERAVQGVVEGKEADGGDGPPELCEEEEKLMAQIDEQKSDYKGQFQTLRKLKSEIEGIQKHLEKARAKMQADFDQWYQALCRRIDDPNYMPAVKGAEAKGHGGGGGHDYKQNGSTTNSSASRAWGSEPGTPPVEAMQGGSYASVGSRSLRPSAVSTSSTSLGSSMRSSNSSHGRGYDNGYQQQDSQHHERVSTSASDGGYRAEDKGPMLTGDKAADADIMAFYKAKQELLARQRK